jgi:hypothetical protein
MARSAFLAAAGRSWGLPVRPKLAHWGNNFVGVRFANAIHDPQHQLRTRDIFEEVKKNGSHRHPDPQNQPHRSARH